MASYTIVAGDESVGTAEDLNVAASLAGAYYVRTGKDVSIIDDADTSQVAELGGSIVGGDLEISALDPESLPAGGTTTNMHVIGTGFREDSVIVFAGNEERTDYVSPSQLSTIVTASLFANPDTVDVFVRNVDGAESNVVPFEFT
jgi:hypothetical protein